MSNLISWNLKVWKVFSNAIFSNPIVFVKLEVGFNYANWMIISFLGVQNFNFIWSGLLYQAMKFLQISLCILAFGLISTQFVPSKLT